MNIHKTTFSILLFTLITVSCNRTPEYDATGMFEAEDVIISAQAAGQLLEFKISEGDVLTVNQRVGLIDTTQLFLTKEQLKAQLDVAESRIPDIETELKPMKEQLQKAMMEQQRISNLLSNNVATQKQLDDIEAEIRLINANIESRRSILQNTVRSLEAEMQSIRTQIAMTNDKISRSLINNPVYGTVLNTYKEAHETVSVGTPMYKVADMSELTLRIYVTGDQLSAIRLNQEITLLTDDTGGNMFEDKGTIFWISDESEFTPKTIQTKNERANKVYATKIRVKNDGRYKIGMYAEVRF